MTGTRQLDRMDAVRDLVRANGRRWTVAKGAVVEALLGTDEHLSVQQVHEQIGARFPQIDRSTVHRVLLGLAEEDVVHVLGRQGEARYGMADRPHHHAVCARCGREAEIPAKVIAPALKSAAAATGFTFTAGSITLTGLCESCSAGTG
ncbi:transcriptional repressor [Actinoplanes sp. LDG1-06]|uniref:Transcriptional repressor n=1 Tax=Paractinoplanes ovalisporus TaxID=2810368 RepID=A0ABS2ARN1_9ACTN|nr:transcriptional repressor [Actinoplanes ovalisporus]MBM2621861.1 transcriptional repressor [Actinoplanes ovalisporus]